MSVIQSTVRKDIRAGLAGGPALHNFSDEQHSITAAAARTVFTATITAADTTAITGTLKDPNGRVVRNVSHEGPGGSAGANATSFANFWNGDVALAAFATATVNAAAVTLTAVRPGVAWSYEALVGNTAADATAAVNTIPFGRAYVAADPADQDGDLSSLTVRLPVSGDAAGDLVGLVSNEVLAEADASGVWGLKPGHQGVGCRQGVRWCEAPTSGSAPVKGAAVYVQEATGRVGMSDMTDAIGPVSGWTFEAGVSDAVVPVRVRK